MCPNSAVLTMLPQSTWFTQILYWISRIAYRHHRAGIWAATPVLQKSSDGWRKDETTHWRQLFVFLSVFWH